MIIQKKIQEDKTVKIQPDLENVVEQAEAGVQGLDVKIEKLLGGNALGIYNFVKNCKIFDERIDIHRIGKDYVIIWDKVLHEAIWIDEKVHKVDVVNNSILVSKTIQRRPINQETGRREMIIVGTKPSEVFYDGATKQYNIPVYHKLYSEYSNVSNDRRGRTYNGIRLKDSELGEINIRMHILVVAKFVKFKILYGIGKGKSPYIIHHRNLNKNFNQPINLEYMPRSAHGELHNKLKDPRERKVYLDNLNQEFVDNGYTEDFNHYCEYEYDYRRSILENVS